MLSISRTIIIISLVFSFIFLSACQKSNIKQAHLDTYLDEYQEENFDIEPYDEDLDREAYQKRSRDKRSGNSLKAVYKSFFSYIKSTKRS